MDYYNNQYKGSQQFAAGFQQAQEVFYNMTLLERILKKPLGKVQLEPAHKESYVWWKSK